MGDLYKLITKAKARLPSVLIYKKKGFSSEQIEAIEFGIKEGVDVSYYDDIDFNIAQMYEIRCGLEFNLHYKENPIDIESYASIENDAGKMHKIRKELEKKSLKAYFGF